jgi:hypothetical protein
MHGKRLIAAAATAALTMGAEPARAMPADVAFGYGFSTHAPGAASGRNFFDEFTNPSDPQAKPEPISHLHIQLPPGTRVDTSAVPQCGASDVELTLVGADACPAGSKLGGETLRVDTGGPGDSRFITADVTFLNNRDQLILVSRDRSSGARVISRGTIGRDTEDFDIPALPGTPPDGGAIKREDGTLPLAGSYTTTPPDCPASGTWTFTATWTFRDGSHRTATSRYPCTLKSAHVPPRPHSPKRHHRARHHAHHPHSRAG